MPRLTRRQGITWARPWLDLPRTAIEAYLRRHRLGFVEDLSNADLRWARNRLRHTVWPALSGAFEHAEISLAAGARRAQEAAACLRELAELDQIQACDSNGALLVARWVALSPARRANLLRTWLARWGRRGVPQTLVRRLVNELPHAISARWPLGSGELRLHAGRLVFAAAADDVRPAFAPTISIDLSHPGWIAVPAWRGAFEVRVAHEGGLPAPRLLRCELRARCGGERFQRSAGALPRCLKKQYQAAGVPAWSRTGPLVFADGDLLYVPALGVDARHWAAPGTPMLALHWVADANVTPDEADADPR
jgi:tRNA(Ile)-lysidine synthase